ncbi:MAG: bifunctional metallophosphatase/5'-nucleotidase [Fibrobacterota bacterium]|nr:MAG: bifunctional metallophosphatase/5'-nucleotidase [Fibrobacterota bacterium]
MQPVFVAIALLCGSQPAAKVDSLAKPAVHARKDTGFSLALVHVNDIHAHLDPTFESMKIQGKSVQVLLGGAAVLKTAFDSLRKALPNALFLHAGDQFTGTAWFSIYRGLADAAVVRRLGFDAFVPGNHEFDIGAGPLRAFLDSSQVPAVVSTLDATREPILAGRMPLFLIREVAGRRIGIVGIANPNTRSISKPGQNLRFLEASSVAKAVDSAKRSGAEVVVALSHAGFEADTLLARTVPGIVCVVGGHSHTRMGAFAGLGGAPPYPVVVTSEDGRRVPVVQAWHRGMEIGVLNLRFDSTFRLTSWEGHPFLPSPAGLAGLASESVRGFVPDSGMSALLQGLVRPLDSLRAIKVARVPSAYSRRKGGELADLCAQSLLEAGASQGARVGIMNRGGVRDDLDSGVVDMEQVQRVAPFGNSVVVMTITGKRLRHIVKILEGRKKNPGMAGLAGERGDKGKWKSFRLAGAATDLEDEDTVRIATNSYLADGGDGCMPLRKSKGYRYDTGIRDDEALARLLSRLFPVSKGK